MWCPPASTSTTRCRSSSCLSDSPHAEFWPIAWRAGAFSGGAAPGGAARPRRRRGPPARGEAGRRSSAPFPGSPCGLPPTSASGEAATRAHAKSGPRAGRAAFGRARRSLAAGRTLAGIITAGQRQLCAFEPSAITIEHTDVFAARPRHRVRGHLKKYRLWATPTASSRTPPLPALNGVDPPGARDSSAHLRAVRRRRARTAAGDLSAGPNLVRWIDLVWHCHLRARRAAACDESVFAVIHAASEDKEDSGGRVS